MGSAVCDRKLPYCMLRLVSLCSSAVFALLIAPIGVAQGNRIIDRDGEFAHGSIKFVRTEEIEGKSLVWHEELMYSSEGRIKYIAKEDSGFGLGPNLRSTTTVIHPQWGYVEEEGNDSQWTVDFRDKSEVVINSNEMFFIAPGPNFPLGAGFSNLDDATWTASLNGGVWKGSLGDGTIIEVVYDDQLLRVPRSATRFWNGNVVNKWSYDGQIEASKDLYVPKRCRYVGGAYKRTFEVQAIDLSIEPSVEETQTQWFRKGVTIIDHRVDPTVGWTFEELKTAIGDGKMDPLVLLELSRQRAAQFRKNDEDKNRSQQRQDQAARSQLYWFLGVFIGVFAIVYSVFRFVTKRRGGS